MEARDSKFTMLLSTVERDMLYKLATKDGLSAAIWLRRIIRLEHKKLDYELNLIATAKE